MPISKYSKKLFLREFNLEDEFAKDREVMGIKDDDEEEEEMDKRMQDRIGAQALKDAESLKFTPTSKDLAQFYKNEKDYKYYIKDGKWRGIIVKDNKEFDVMQYPSTVEKLNKEFGTDIGVKKDAKDQSDTQNQSDFSKEEYENLEVVWQGTGKYNPQGVKLVQDELEKNKEKYPSLNNPYFQIAILSKVGAECYFTPGVEKNYKTVARAKAVFNELKVLSDEQVQALINDPKEFWDYIYGLGSAVNIDGVSIPEKSKASKEKRSWMENDKRYDGYKYRGRGYVQFTGKSKYRDYGPLVGLDGVNDPDSFADPVKAAPLVVPRVMNGLDSFLGGVKDYKDQDSANYAVTTSIAGTAPRKGAVARTAAHNKNFKIVKRKKETMAERKIISEKNLRRLMRFLIKENSDERKPQSKEEGNKFRKWVNDNIGKSEIEDLFKDLKDKKFDLEGNINNTHFNRAWEEYGIEYLEDSVTANPDDEPGESQTSDQSEQYPDSKENAAVMDKDEKYRYYVKDIGGKKYWVGITMATGNEHIFKGETKSNKKGVDVLNKYFGTNFTASEPKDTRDFVFYPSESPDKMQPAERGIPERYFKFRRGDRTTKSMEVFGMTARGDIYYTSNTDPDIAKDEKGRLMYIKLNETRSIKKVLINESGTKARIFLENISVTKKFDLTKEFMKDLQALNLSDEEVPGIVQAEGEAETKIDAMKKPKQPKQDSGGNSDWAKHIQTGFIGMERKDAQRALGKFIPADVDGKNFLDWAIGYWQNKPPTSHRNGLAFDLVPLSRTTYKDLNTAINEFKKHASGLTPWDETGTGSGVSWSNDSPVGSASNEGAHYHFTVDPSFSIKDSGKKIIADTDMNPNSITHVIGYGPRHYKNLAPKGQEAFLLFGAILKKLDFKVKCTSTRRTPESQVRIMLQQAAGRELGKAGAGINWLKQYKSEDYGIKFGNALMNGSVDGSVT